MASTFSLVQAKRARGAHQVVNNLCGVAGLRGFGVIHLGPPLPLGANFPPVLVFRLVTMWGRCGEESTLFGLRKEWARH